ncbi:hypothetical protein [Methylosinus sp. Ce-a6]|uniref:hypothetical protein n=1 Tax=Methylosinus sp. Ce-a6 TaxID=2172005 RepID=UPI00135ABE23|nr:hypothetical protein [Methylosinus sp. Ce-a6]
MLSIEKSPAFILDPTEHVRVGRDPRDMTREELASCGHEVTPVLSAIRAKCLDCSGGAPSETRRCLVVQCALWPFRMGANPFRAEREMSDEQRAAAAERLAKARAARGSAA